jgi:hypothetical protein
VTSYRLQLRPGGIIPPAMTLGVVMRKETAAAAAAAAEAAAAVTIAAGADDFIDATEIAYAEFRDVLAAYTYNKDYTVEVGEPSETGAPLSRTAWWKLLVPADTVCYLTADLQLSFVGAGNSAVDTTLTVFGQNSGTVPTGFGDIDWYAKNDDVGTTATPNTLMRDWTTDGFYSRVDYVELDGSGSGNAEGTWFYIQAGLYSDLDYPHGLALRVSITETYPGYTPPDGRNPSA